MLQELCHLSVSIGWFMLARTYAIVEPIPGCAYEDRPVVGVIAIAVPAIEITGLFLTVSLGVSRGLK